MDACRVEYGLYKPSYVLLLRRCRSEVYARKAS